VTQRGASVTLVDDQGRPHAFTLVDVIEVAEQRYAVLQPEDEASGAVLFRVDGETLTPVEDDEEFERVVAELRETGEYDDLAVTEDDDISPDGEVN